MKFPEEWGIGYAARSDARRAEYILRQAMEFLRKRSRLTRRGNYTVKQLWLGAANRWRDSADRDAYYSLYRLLAHLDLTPTRSKIPEKT